MHFVKISEGFVHEIGRGDAKQVAAGPRCVRTKENQLFCTFYAQEALGINNYEVMWAESDSAGETWTGCRSLWPQWQGIYSTIGSVSRSANGELFVFGSRTVIDQPGELDWCEATQGLKQNELIYARSEDSGRTWTVPQLIPMPIAGSAEAPGALCALNNGRWIAPYSPYQTFDPQLKVDRNQVIAMYSDDRGNSWNHAAMMRFENVNSNGAEAWITELSDGRLLGTCWHLNQQDGSDYPNAFAVSRDSGSTWSRTGSTGINGQSTALAAYKDGKALFIYNQRKHSPAGIWLALAKPTEDDFGIEANEIIWAAETRTQSGLTSGGHSEWRDFSFGEPSVTVLPDDRLLVMFWCIQPSGSGIKYLKLKIVH
jgi:hypothetical protein